MAETNADIVREFTVLFERGDRDAWRRYFHEDIIWDASQSNLLLAGVTRGHKGVEQFFIDWLGTWEEYEVTHSEIIDAGDSVVVVFHQRGRGKGSGIEMERDFFGVYDLRDGQVIRYTHFESRDEALEAVGLKP